MATLSEITAGTGYQNGFIVGDVLDRWAYRGFTVSGGDAARGLILSTDDSDRTTLRQPILDEINNNPDGAFIWFEYTGNDTTSADNSMRLWFANGGQDLFGQRIIFNGPAGNELGHISYTTSDQSSQSRLAFIPVRAALSTSRHIQHVVFFIHQIGGTTSAAALWNQLLQLNGIAFLQTADVTNFSITNPPGGGYEDFIFTLPTTFEDQLVLSGEAGSAVGTAVAGTTSSLHIDASGNVFRVLDTDPAMIADSYIDSATLDTSTSILTLGYSDSKADLTVDFSHLVDEEFNLRVTEEGGAAIQNVNNVVFDNRHFAVTDNGSGQVEVVLTASAAGGGAEWRDGADTSPDPAIVMVGNGLDLVPTNVGSATETATFNLQVPVQQTSVFSDMADAQTVSRDNLASGLVVTGSIDATTSSGITTLTGTGDQFFLENVQFSTTGSFTDVFDENTTNFTAYRIENLRGDYDWQVGQRGHAFSTDGRASFLFVVTGYRFRNGQWDFDIRIEDLGWFLTVPTAASVAATPIPGWNIYLSTPLPNNVARFYTHEQSSPNSTWIINHNLGNNYPVITVYDDTNEVVIPMEITSTNINRTTITFPVDVSGNATVVG